MVAFPPSHAPLSRCCVSPLSVLKPFGSLTRSADGAWTRVSGQWKMRGACTGEARCCSREWRTAKGGRVKRHTEQVKLQRSIVEAVGALLEDFGVSWPVVESGSRSSVPLVGVRISTPSLSSSSVRAGEQEPPQFLIVLLILLGAAPSYQRV